MINQFYQFKNDKAKIRNQWIPILSITSLSLSQPQLSPYLAPFPAASQSLPNTKRFRSRIWYPLFHNWWLAANVAPPSLDSHSLLQVEPPYLSHQIPLSPNLPQKLALCIKYLRLLRRCKNYNYVCVPDMHMSTWNGGLKRNHILRSLRLDKTYSQFPIANFQGWRLA